MTMLGKKAIETDAERLRLVLGGSTNAGNHGALSGLGNDDHGQYLHLSNARTITAQHTFAPTSPQAPFALGANAQGQLVTGFRADQLAKNVTAGNGLTGGGSLTASVTLNVGAGAGITVNADDVALTTPGTLSITSTNDPVGNHTHAVTASSNPHNTASLLASASDGGLQLLRFGIGTPPEADDRITIVDQGQVGMTAGPLLTFTGDKLILDGGRFRLAYNADNYADLETDSGGTLVITPTGNLTLQPAGDITINPTGNDVLPYQGYDINLGAINKKYLTLHAAELWVETLVAQDTVATIGGRILVGPTTMLVDDLPDFTLSADYFIVKHNQMIAGDVVYMEADGKVEFFRIATPIQLYTSLDYSGYFRATGDYNSLFSVLPNLSVNVNSGGYSDYEVEATIYDGFSTHVKFVSLTPLGVSSAFVRYGQDTGKFAYPVERNLDGSGNNAWYAGDAVFNTGQTGNGFIDLYSLRGVRASSQAGPTIVGNVRASSTYNDWIEHWAIGNLNGIYGYGTDTYGAAFGKYANGSSFLTADATNGIRMRHRSGGADTTMAQWAMDGTITIGRVAASYDNIVISSGAISIRNNTTNRIHMTAAGVLTINNSAGNAVFTFNSSSGAEFTLPLTLGSAGGIYQGTGTFASPTTGLKIWNDGGVGRIAGYNGGTLQWGAGTDGRMYAGAGNVTLDSTGIKILNSGSQAAHFWNVSGYGACLYFGTTIANRTAYLDETRLEFVGDKKVSWKSSASSGDFGNLRGYEDITTALASYLVLSVAPATGYTNHGQINLQATGYGGSMARIRLQGNQTGSSSFIDCYVNGATPLAITQTHVAVTGTLTATSTIRSNTGFNVNGTAGLIYVPIDTLLTNASWDGTAKSTVSTTTALNLRTAFSLPTAAKAVAVSVLVRDSAASGDWSVSFGPTSSQWFHFSVRAVPNDILVVNNGIINVDASGNIYYRIYASGTNTLDVWFRIHGYFI